jgi:transmembrane protein TMEM174 (potassium channel)
MSKGRLEAFTDGVLAIAATLLILNVDRQVGPEVGNLGNRLFDLAVVRHLRRELHHDRHHLGEQPHPPVDRRTAAAR